MSDLNSLIQPFNAVNGHNASTVSVSSSGSSANVLLPVVSGQSTSSSPGPGQQIGQILVYNSGSVTAFIAFGGGSVAATAPSGSTAGGTPVAPGEMMTLTVLGNPGYAAAIAPGGTAVVVYFTPGAGT